MKKVLIVFIYILLIFGFVAGGYLATVLLVYEDWLNGGLLSLITLLYCFLLSKLLKKLRKK